MSLKKILLLILMLSLITLTFISCKENEDDDDTRNSSGAITLNVYNWGEYISDGSFDSLDVNKAFEEYYFKKYGKRVVVNYTTYATNEDMYSKLKNSAVVYDIVVPSDYMIEKMI